MEDRRPTTDDRSAVASSPHPPIPSSTAAQAVAIPKSATPIALRIAQELGVDLAAVDGTGPGGKITREDVEAAAKRNSELKSELRIENVESAPVVPVVDERQNKESSIPNKEHATVGKVRATPAARRVAREAGVNLADVQGSGPNARVQASDVGQAQVSNAKPQAPVSQPQPKPQPQPQPQIDKGQSSRVNRRSSIPYTGMRKTIGTRLTQSYQELPHITFDADADVTLAEQLRARVNAKLKAGQSKVSLTAIVVKACAWALRRHPLINSRLDLAAGQIDLLDEINVGVAVALENGLVVPVIRQADAKGIQAIANELSDLAARAKTNKLKADELQGGTFSISNLGMYGVTRFTAIINPPETAILAVGASHRQFVPDANDQPVLRTLMGLRLSADHRVIDGAVAAQFLAEVTAAIEDPALMAV